MCGFKKQVFYKLCHEVSNIQVRGPQTFLTTGQEVPGVLANSPALLPLQRKRNGKISQF